MPRVLSPTQSKGAGEIRAEEAQAKDSDEAIGRHDETQAKLI